MNIPNSEEHLEALNSDLDKLRKDYKRKLPASNRKLFTKIEKVADECEKNGVPFIFLGDFARTGVFWKFNNFFYKKYDDRFSNEASSELVRILFIIVGGFVTFLSQMFAGKRVRILVEEETMWDSNDRTKDSD